MDKMRMESPDLTEQNIEKIGNLFPNCITESKDENGKIKKAINFELLKQMLSHDIVEGDEAYEFTWVGKKASMVEANSPIRKTLRPCKEESVNWDTTENLYIEGDNLKVLKLLQNSYFGKVKMIYIDPPYNTGSDFVYPDSFVMDNDTYNKDTSYFDEEGNVNYNRTNEKERPRFHSDWCSMIYSRLMVARNLLSEDGVIFISIDDNEVENLTKMCNEIFGATNHVATFLWTKTSTPPSLSYKCRKTVEYVLAYEKSISKVKYYGNALDGGDVPFLNTGNPIKTITFPEHSINIKYMNNGTINMGTKEKVTLLDDIFVSNGWNSNAVKISGEFKWEQKTVDTEVNDGTYFLVKSEKFSIRFQRKDVTDSYKTPTNYLNVELNKESEVGTNETAAKDMTELGLGKLFDYAKPFSLVEQCIKMICKNDKELFVLDFFSGSATTAHAVMQLNAEDNGHRKFIMVQLPELTNEKSEAYKAGYKNICEIGKERIRRAGKKIKEENPLTTADLDIGFRVFKIDDSNMNDVYYSADEYTQDLLSSLESNIKADRTDLDLLFGCILDWGLPLSMPYVSENIDGYMVHTYNDGDLVACFEEDIPQSVIEKIAEKKPLRAVFRDSCFKNSPGKINVGEIFKSLAPNTSVKVM